MFTFVHVIGLRTTLPILRDQVHNTCGEVAGQTSGHPKQTHSFPDPNQVVSVPKPNQTIDTVLPQHKKRKSNLKKCKVPT